MAKLHSKNLDLLLGAYNVSQYFKDAEVGASRQEADVTNFASTAMEFLVGQTEGEVSLGGFFDAGTNAIVSQLEAMIGAAAGTPFTMAWQGTETLHNFAAVTNLKLTKVSPKSSVGSAVLIELTGRPNAGPDFGVVLAANDAARGTGSTSFPGYDWGVTDVNAAGWAASLHVLTIVSGSPALAGKLQTSADASSYADLSGGAFSLATVISAEYLSSSTPITDNSMRAVRWNFAISGSGTMFYVAVFAKKR